MKTARLSFFALAIFLSGCSSQVLVSAPNHITDGVVCITPDDSNRKVAYNCTIDALRKKGYTVKEIGYNQVNDPDCDAVLMCQSVSRWDVANFTSQIRYEWSEEGKVIARCNYHHKGGLSFSKFINTGEKVNDLLNKMLPNSRQLNSRYSSQSSNW